MIPDTVRDAIHHSRWEFSPSAADPSEGRFFVTFDDGTEAQGTFEVCNGTISLTLETKSP